MNEWSIIVVRLQTLLSNVDAAYDHVQLIDDGADDRRDCIGRTIWEARSQLRDAISRAREARDEAARYEAKVVSHVQ